MMARGSKMALRVLHEIARPAGPAQERMSPHKPRRAPLGARSSGTDVVRGGEIGRYGYPPAERGSVRPVRGEARTGGSAAGLAPEAVDEKIHLLLRFMSKAICVRER